MATGGVHDATPADLAAWDARAVDGPGGSIWQSRAWAEHAAQRGWRTRHLVDAAGVPLLVLLRPWPGIAGAGAYLPRGPVSAGDPPARIVERLVGVTEALARDGVDVLATDAEVPAATGYPALLRGAGFAPIEEIQPSRHRMAVPLTADVPAAWEGIAKKTRQRIGSAQRRGLVVRRFDLIGGAPPVAPRRRGRQPRRSACRRPRGRGGRGVRALPRAAGEHGDAARLRDRPARQLRGVVARSDARRPPPVPGGA